MGKADAGSTKAIANAIKAKGLGRLRWYCQICEKQCRDENGFQAHTRSEPHMRKMLLVGPKAGQTIAEFSRQFQYEFLTLLRTRHTTQRVRANTVYNEYIQDKHHVHMNATRWVTLNGFIMTLGKAGLVKVDEDDKGLWITWVDNSPSTLAKQAALQRKDRAEMDGEERERKMLEQQITRARDAAEEQERQDAEASSGLQKKDGEKISLSFSLNLPSTTTTTTTTTTIPAGTAVAVDATNTDVEAQAGPSKLPSNTITTTSISFGAIPTIPTASNPLKRPAVGNIFKSAKAPKTSTSTGESNTSSGGSLGKMGSGNGAHGQMSEVERLMKEDKARKAGVGGYGGFGPRRGGPGPGR